MFRFTAGDENIFKVVVLIEINCSMTKISTCSSEKDEKSKRPQNAKTVRKNKVKANSHVLASVKISKNNDY